MHQSKTLTIWHITVGTHGCRLHGGDRPTVDKQHNQVGMPFLYFDRTRADYESELMRGPPVQLTLEQRIAVEELIPQICIRGNWNHIVSAAPPDADHFHLLLEVDQAIHGKDVRKWLKRWLSQELTSRFNLPACGEWWAHGGSTKVVNDDEYYRNAFEYVAKQRTTAP